MTYLEAVSLMKEIESRYDLMQIKYKGVSVWPLLRINIVDAISGNNETMKSTGGSAIKQVLSTLFYYNPFDYFKKRSVWLFAGFERRKEVNGLKKLRVSGCVIDACENTLVIEKPGKDQSTTPRSMVPEKDVVSESWLLLFVHAYAILTKWKKIKIENECVLQRVLKEYKIQFDYIGALRVLDAQKKVFELAETGNSEEYVPIRQVVLNALDVIERASKTKGTVTGIPTGFIDLDYKLSGLQRSDLVLIAARPSMGKTAFVLNIAQHVAFRQNLAVAIFSLEMSKEQLVNRLFSLESHVDAQILRTGNLSDTDWEKLIEGAGTIGSSRMIIDDTSGITISEMRSKCRKYKLEMGLDLVIIDYLQLMSGSNSRRNESRQQEISEISRSLKGLARELNVPVIALSQLSRAVEQRTDKRPMLSDLRESGAIEQDADVCMFIYRDDYYNPDTEDKNIAEIIIAKQRNGPIGTVRLAWMPQYTRFGNEERRQERDS